MGSIKLGNFIKQSEKRNDEGIYQSDSVVGLSTQKQIIKTKADLNGVNLSSYKLMPPGYFAYVPDTSRRGDKMSLAYNQTTETYLVSSISIVFFVSSPDILLSDYLFMYYNRPEFDKYARFNSWGSARETFSWDEMCDIEIDLPPLSVQQKYVDIYNAMLANQRGYERGLDNLKLTCDAYIEELRREMPCVEIGDYITRTDIRNGEHGTQNVMGISVTKEFRIPTSKVNKNDLANYKIVKPRQIAFVQTTHNEKVFAFAFNNTNEDIVVSSINEVFYCNETKLLPEYLSMFLSRKEFDRYARFHSWGSARETFTWNDLVLVKIPIPEIAIQQDIVNIYNAYILRKNINEQLKAQIKGICPILIKGSVEEASA